SHNASRLLISYTIRVDPADLSGFEVEMRVRGADNIVLIAMASHPEYDDRYWRYVENLSAESRDTALKVTREEDALWRVEAPAGDFTVRYRIHLPPQTAPIRSAWKPFLSPTGGLIGDVNSFLYVVGEAFKIFGKAPYHSYTFLYQDGAQGALEHLNSVTIGARSQSLAQRLTGVFDTTAHEYFHTWNLMHVRPVERVGVRYRPANPTGELWWSEGVTIYFSDLLLRRAKLPTFDPTRVAHLETYIAAYLLTPGYSRISAERASRAADDPLALGDDYAETHLQGSLLGAMLDLMIHEATHGQRSLDDVMRTLSEQFTPRRGITGRDIERVVHEVCA